MSDHDDYEVGYRKPPKATQFKAGHSGNPRGRPKNSKNIKTIIGELLEARVSVVENGRRKTVSTLEALMKRLVVKAHVGDHRSLGLLLELGQLHGEPPAAQESHEQFESTRDDAVKQDLFRRLRASAESDAQGAIKPDPGQAALAADPSKEST